MITFQRASFLVYLLCFPLLALATEEIQTEEIITSSTTTTTTTSSTPSTTVEEIIIDPKLNITKDLFASETADPKKVDIVKQIRRLNEDGSYTVGYEAGDGTFKIESRDVQGNIKGTFGYVDEDGEIKRVSYSTVNNSSQPPSLVPFLQSSRVNRTSTTTTTTKKPQPIIIYPKTNGGPTRPTVIQPIPRRRIATTSTTTPSSVSSTESYSTVAANVVSVNTSEDPVTPEVIRTVSRFPVFTPRTETSKPVYIPQGNTPMVEPKIYKPVNQGKLDVSDTASTTTPSYVRPVGIFEKTVEKQREKPVRANTFRRQLNAPFENEHMTHFHQTIGEDTTDVYGGSLNLGTARPLFTTTTLRPRLVPIHSILASRQRMQEKLAGNPPQVHEDQQETTLEASTNKITDESYVTSNPIPVVQIPVTTPEIIDQRVIERPFLRRHPSNTAQFKTREFLRDNPGAAIPIGNQRILFRYNPNIQVGENSGQYARPIIAAPVPAANLVPIHQEGIPVNQAGIPQQRYQIYTYPQERQQIIPQRVPMPQPQPQPSFDITNQIQAPVSTRDLKKLLQLLLIRQNRFQTLMDIREDINPYESQAMYEPEYRPKSAYGPRSVYPGQYSEQQRYSDYTRQVPYPYQPPYEPNQYPRSDYRSQDDGYRNEITTFNPAIPYESQRYVPRRRYFRPRTYDPRYDVPMQDNPEPEDFLPADVREALLLKMLMLAINPDFVPGPPEPQGMMTTQAPEFRKKVRNVQILGEVSDANKDEDSKRKSRAM